VKRRTEVPDRAKKKEAMGVSGRALQRKGEAGIERGHGNRAERIGTRPRSRKGRVSLASRNRAVRNMGVKWHEEGARRGVGYAVTTVSDAAANSLHVKELGETLGKGKRSHKGGPGNRVGGEVKKNRGRNLGESYPPRHRTRAATS